MAWTPLTTVINGTNPVLYADATSGDCSQRFYRVSKDTGLFHADLRHTGIFDDMRGTNAAVLKWKFPTQAGVFSSPIVVQGVVYCGSLDTNFYALNAETGEELWHFKTSGGIRSSAAMLDGKVYFSSGDGFLYALQAASGTEIWRCRIAATNQLSRADDWDYFDSSPAILDRTIYVGSSDRQVYAIDAATGQTNWTFQTKARVRSSPAIVDGIVYVGGLDGYLYALDAASGTNLWKFKVQGNGGFPNGEIYHAPAVVDGMIYFGSRDSAVYAVDATTGTRKWRRDLAGGSSWVFNSPAVWNGLVYAGTSIPGYLCANDLNTGKLKWQYSLPAQEYSSPAIVNGVAYFGTGDALAARTAPATPKAVPAFFYAVNAVTGKLIWRLKTDGQVHSSPTVANGRIYYGCLDQFIYCLE
jgi:outer membrane protein assembly factor BamB